MSARRRALAAGLAVVAVYASAAAVSGRLSPLARRPLLDGLAPPTAYRWVDPPPELAPTNREPTPGSFEVRLGPAGSRTAVLTTGDAQVTLILPEGSFASAEGQRGVEVTIDPVAPSRVEDPEPPLLILGNVYVVDATYLPSGRRAPLGPGASVVLVYPLLANDHGAHTVILSRDGRRWRSLDTDDLPSIQQASADVDRLGNLAVAGSPPSPTAGAAAGDASSPVATIVIVTALVVLSVVAGFLLRRSASG